MKRSQAKVNLYFMRCFHREAVGTGILLNILLVFGLLSSAVLVDAAVAPPQAREVVVDHARLDNGLDIYVYEDHSAPVVSINVWYKVGSRDEEPRLLGMAHLLEHMMFNGSKNVPKNGHAQIIDAVGGVENAFTSNDVTVYWDKVPSDELALALKLEAERMSNLEITEEKVEIEKEVVKEEFRVRIQNDAIGTALNELMAKSLEGTPYAWTPAGVLETIDAITAADLRRFYETYYVPNNAVLVVAGDTDISTVTRLAEEAFGSIPPGQVPVREPIELSQGQGPRYDEIKMPLQLPAILGGYIIPGTTSDDITALQMASLVLSAGQSSRLYKKLVRETGQAVAAAGYAHPFRDAGLFLNFAFYLSGGDPDAIIAVMREEIEGLAENPPSESELTKARNQVAASYAFSLDSLDGVANAIGSAVVLERGIEDFVKGLDPYFAVTAQDVQSVVAKYLKPENLTVLKVQPGPPLIRADEKAKAGLDQGETGQSEILHGCKQAEVALSEERMQQLAEQFKWSAPRAKPMELPPISHFQLKNGLNVWVVERHSQPIAAVQLVMPVGSLQEPEGLEGLSSFSAAMLRQGTKTRTAEEISEAIESVGGSLGAWAGQETTVVSSQVMSKDIETAIDLMADITINPAFPKKEAEILRRQFLASIQRRRDSASTFASDQAVAFYYGSNHPLGRLMSEESISSISVEDMAAFAKKYYRPEGAILIAVGDIDPVRFQELVSEKFGGWQSSDTGENAENLAVNDKHAMSGGSKLKFIEKPGQTQVQIRLVQNGPTKDSEDWIPVELYNYILGGGGFSSRLMKVIRTHLGETYGISTNYTAGKYTGIFMLSTFTRNEELYDTMAVIKSELKKFANSGVTAQELQYAKANRIGSYPLQFETLGGMAGTIVDALRYGSLEEIECYPLLVDDVGIEEINEAIATHFDPDNLAIVLLGDPSVYDQVVKVAELFGIKPDAIEKTKWSEAR